MNALSLAVESHVREYLRGFESYYPQIQDWYGKVCVEARQGRRSILAAYSGPLLSGLSIVKHERDAKLCHFSLMESVRRLGFGRTLMQNAISELVRHGARSVHVTTSEEVAETFGDFFVRCGFRLEGYQKNRYRRGGYELLWLAGSKTVLERVTGPEGPKVPQTASLVVLGGASGIARTRVQSWAGTTPTATPRIEFSCFSSQRSLDRQCP